jgi:hypothetical protein
MSGSRFVNRLACALLLEWMLATAAAASPLFEGQEAVELELAGPLGSLFENREEQVERPFVLRADGVEVPLKVSLRGHSRARICDFPPLRLNFPHAVDAQSIFAGQDRLKLVTHCRNYDRGEQDLLEEYLAYRVLNVLTDLSYSVRLLRIHYHDTDGELPAEAARRYGFVIESREEFSARTGARNVELAGFPRYRHDPHHAALMYVFQYLIANTDWMLLKADYDDGCCHNLELFERDSGLIFVPYDFDVAGLINAKYAFPDAKLRIKRVTQRLYRGLCTDRDILRDALRTVRSKRDEILALPGDIPGLQPDNAERARDYLEDFFAEAADEEDLLDRFEKHCIERY